MKQEIPYKIYLSENELPKAWINLRAFMKNKPAPLLNPETKAPMTKDELSQVFCEELVKQELISRGVESKKVHSFGLPLNIKQLSKLDEEEILFIMSHEMAHYVEKHLYIGIAGYLLLTLAGLWLTSRVMEWAISRYGQALKVSSSADFRSITSDTSCRFPL